MRQRRAYGAVRWIVISAGIVAAAVVAISLFWLSRPVVTVTRVIEGPVIDSFYATGTVEPITEYPIKTSNAGIITKLMVDRGSRVKRGQPLAVVEDPQLKFALDKAIAQLKQAQERADDKVSPVLQEYDAKLAASAAMLKNAKDEEKRMWAIQAEKGVSLTDAQRASDRVQDQESQGKALAAQRRGAQIQLQTDLRIAEAAVAAAQTDVDHQTLVSPIDGVVLDRPTPLGTRMAVNVNDHVMQIADVRAENLVMRAAVDEESKPGVKQDQVVQMALYAFPGEVFEGRVTKIYDKADTDRRTFEVDVKFEKLPDSLSAGMTGELAFIRRRKERALIAPAQSLQQGAIYVVRDGRLVHEPKAVVGIKSVERIELVNGLRDGDVIVISPVQGLRENAPVRTTMVDPKVAAGLNSPKGEATFKGFH